MVLVRLDMTKLCPPPFGILKFNVDGAARGNPGLAGIGGALRNCRG